MKDNLKKLQKNSYELFVLHNIFSSNFFFICFLNDTKKTEFIEFKKFCAQHQIILQVFKNKIVKKAIQETKWSILQNIIYSQLIVGYKTNNKIYTVAEMEQLANVLSTNKAVGFLFGFFSPIIVTPAILISLKQYTNLIVAGLSNLSSIRSRVLQTLFFKK